MTGRHTSSAPDKAVEQFADGVDFPCEQTDQCLDELCREPTEQKGEEQWIMKQLVDIETCLTGHDTKNSIRIMRFLQYETGANDTDRRLDRVLRRFLPETELGELYKAIRKGLIRVNEKKTTQNYRIQEHDVIGVAEFLIQGNHPAKEQKAITQPQIDLEILFRNQQLLVINKPYDIPVQKAQKNQLSLDEIIRKQYRPEDNSLSFTPGPLHRLDRKTTGILCFSQNLTGARTFSTLIQSHDVAKTYVALLSGRLTEDATWKDYIGKDGDSEGASSAFHTVSVSATADEAGKESITMVHPIAFGSWKGKPVTFAEIQILTGRTHQIRSQCASHGFPLLGDTAYGGPAITAPQDFFLHAIRLRFPPDSSLQVPPIITAPLPGAFHDFITVLFDGENQQKIDFFTHQSYNSCTD